MINSTNRFRLPSLLLIALVVIVGILVLSFVYGSANATPPQASSNFTHLSQGGEDALARALTLAEARGMKEQPDSFFVKLGTFKEFAEEDESWPLWENRQIWAIRFDKHFTYSAHGHSLEVDHLVVFIDEQTGVLAGERAGVELTPPLQRTEWQQVQVADVGKFHIGNANMPAEFYSQGVKDSSSPSATAVPQK